MTTSVIEVGERERKRMGKGGLRSGSDNTLRYNWMDEGKETFVNIKEKKWWSWVLSFLSQKGLLGDNRPAEYLRGQQQQQHLYFVYFFYITYFIPITRIKNMPSFDYVWFRPRNNKNYTATTIWSSFLKNKNCLIGFSKLDFCLFYLLSTLICWFLSCGVWEIVCRWVGGVRFVVHMTFSSIYLPNYLTWHYYCTIT